MIKLTWRDKGVVPPTRTGPRTGSKFHGLARGETPQRPPTLADIVCFSPLLVPPPGRLFVMATDRHGTRCVISVPRTRRVATGCNGKRSRDRAHHARGGR